MKKIRTFYILVDLWVAVIFTVGYLKMGDQQPWWKYVLAVLCLVAVLYVTAERIDQILVQFLPKDVKRVGDDRPKVD